MTSIALGLFWLDALFRSWNKIFSFTFFRVGSFFTVLMFRFCIRVTKNGFSVQELPDYVHNFWRVTRNLRLTWRSIKRYSFKKGFANSFSKLVNSCNWPISLANNLRNYEITSALNSLNNQCPSYIKTSQLICRANHLTGFYTRVTLIVKALINIE